LRAAGGDLERRARHRQLRAQTRQPRPACRC
jgi:hypothetical protein